MATLCFINSIFCAKLVFINMPLIIQRIIKFPAVFLTITALVFGFMCVGMFHTTSTTMEGMAITPEVSLKSKQTCCGGTMSEHVQSWTSTFLTTSQNLRNDLALLALGPLLVLVFARSRFSFASTDQLLISSKLYLRQRPNLIIFNPLRLAFARGILHPKLY